VLRVDEIYNRLQVGQYLLVVIYLGKEVGYLQKKI